MRSGAVAERDLASLECGLVAILREGAHAAMLQDHSIGAVRLVANVARSAVDRTPVTRHADHPDRAEIAESDLGLEGMSIRGCELRSVDARRIERIPGAGS